MELSRRFRAGDLEGWSGAGESEGNYSYALSEFKKYIN
jgi:hypothetical protein